ncbi:MAG: hypothetical protein RLZZ488_2189 [Pseudomonadota bacterium]
MLTKISLGVAAVMVSSACVKNQYDLQMRLLSEGKEISAPRVTVREGEKATIIEESANKKTQIDVLAKELQNSIALDVNVRTSETGQTGSLVHTGSFLINVTPNEKAQINFNKDQTDSAKFISTLEITAKKRETAPQLTTAGNSTLTRRVNDLK